MLSIWLQWINTMVWYPTILSFIAGTAAYIIKPELAQNKGYLVAVTLLTFWILTWVNLKGIEFSAKVNGICVLIGTMFPMLFLVALGGIWITSGMPLAIKLDSASIFPSWTMRQIGSPLRRLWPLFWEWSSPASSQQHPQSAAQFPESDGLFGPLYFIFDALRIAGDRLRHPHA